MKIAIFSTKPHDRDSLGIALSLKHELSFFQPRLDSATALLAEGFDAVCVFVGDHLDEACLKKLAFQNIRFVVLRCAGFNNIDIPVAERLGIQVARVPAYAPHAIAEHAVALILAVNRKTHHAYNRIREGNFSLTGLMGFGLKGKTIGVVGTGSIGKIFARIMLGFGCHVVAHDPFPDQSLIDDGVTYLSLDELLPRSFVISLHCPLTSETEHLISTQELDLMPDGAVLVNTGRGALIDTPAVINSLKSGRLGALGIDVYEEEDALFFEDHSGEIPRDDVFARLLTFPNVLVTGHQGFFTKGAIDEIARITASNLDQFECDGTCENQVRLAKKPPKSHG